MRITGLPDRVAGTLSHCDEVPFATILQLNKLWKIVINEGESTPPAIAFDEPVLAGEHKVFRPTYAAIRFLERLEDSLNEDKRFDEDDIERIVPIAQFWSLENGRDRNALQAFDFSTVDTFLTDYLSSLTITPDEMHIAIDAAFSGFPTFILSLDQIRDIKDEKKEEDDAPKEDYLAMAQAMAKRFGENFSFWLYDFSKQAVVWLSHTSISNHTPEGESPDPNSPVMVAQANYMKYHLQVLHQYGKEDDPHAIKLREEYPTIGDADNG